MEEKKEKSEIKKINRKIITCVYVIFTILLIFSIIYILAPFYIIFCLLGNVYTVDASVLSDNERDRIIEIIPIEDKESIKLSEIAYEHEFRHESQIFITFEISKDEYEKMELKYEILAEKNDKITIKYTKLIFATSVDPDFLIIKECVDKYK